MTTTNEHADNSNTKIQQSVLARAELVRDAQAGDCAAFNALSGHILPGMMRYARQCLRNEHDADEVVQDVLLLAWTNIGKLRNPNGFKTWVGTILRNCIVNHVNKKKRRILLDSNACQTVVAKSGRSDQLAIQGEDAEQLQRAVSELDEMYREVIAQHYFDGQKVKFIAQRLEVPIGTVKRRLHHARKLLRLKLAAMNQTAQG